MHVRKDRFLCYQSMYEAKYLLITCLWVNVDQDIEDTNIVGGRWEAHEWKYV
jgi:hypothetical protein